MDEQNFKAALGRLASGVTIITCRDGQGAPIGFTASSFTSLSLHPPLVLFCLDRAATSFSAFHSASDFGVNILSTDQQALSHRFGGRDADKFQRVNLLECGEVPLLKGCLANLECRVTEKIPGGDHLIFLGEVHKVHLKALKTLKTEESAAPLIYYGGKYHRLSCPS